MKSNPGGLVSSKDVVGRDGLIRLLWRLLHGDKSPEGQSLVLVAERRMGKTSVVRKMADEAPPGVKVLIRDVAGLNTTLEFTGRLLSDALPHFSKRERATKTLGDLWDKLGGVEVGGVIKFPPTAATHWKELLERVIEQIGAIEDTRFVLVWDEFPLMLQNIAREESLAQAKALLNNLRALRQSYPRGPRMVYTGSIGLHHVIAELRDAGNYANSPVNDMKTEEVPPLAAADARALATALFVGESLGPDPGGVAAAHLATAVDGVAFYIHQVVHALFRHQLPATPENIDNVINDALVDALDPWDLQNFRTRLKPYYGASAPVANAVLEALAAAETLTLDALLGQLSLRLASQGSPLAKRIVSGERSALSELVELMMKDHYLVRRTDGALRFRFGVLRRWWQLH